MNRIVRTLLVPAALAAATAVQAQPGPLERLPVDVLDAMAPSERVSGTPGRIAVEDRACRNLPREHVRRRIVDLAILEWGYFGFTTVARIREPPATPARRATQTPGLPRRGRTRRPLDCRLLVGDAGWQLDTRASEPNLARLQRCTPALARPLVGSIYLLGHV